jgi:hypothetical protein
MVTLHECDRCRKITVNLETVKAFEYRQNWWDGMADIELCKDCWKDYKGLVKDFMRNKNGRMANDKIR